MALRRESSFRGRRLRLGEALLERFAASPVGYRYLLHIAPHLDRIVIPRTNGRWSSAGRDKVGLLTATGAKSGEPRTQPITFIDDGHGLLAVGSNYGRPQHPGWSANLLAHPDCTVEFRGPPTPHRAVLLTGEERARAWESIIDFYIGYELYRARCAPREIRVFRLHPTT